MHVYSFILKHTHSQPHTRVTRSLRYKQKNKGENKSKRSIRDRIEKSNHTNLQMQMRKKHFLKDARSQNDDKTPVARLMKIKILADARAKKHIFSLKRGSKTDQQTGQDLCHK